MRDALLPAALLGASLGLTLGLAPWRTIALGLALLAAAALLASRLPLAGITPNTLFLGTAIATGLTAATAYLPRRHRPRRLLAALALNAGGWAGALIAATPPGQAPGSLALPLALAAALVAVPAALVAARGWDIAVKVAASWLIAVAMLSATLPIVPTPGYVSDHMQ